MKKLLTLLLLVLVALAGCTTASAGELEISDVWGRSSPAVAQNGAFYMTIRNNTDQDEQLLGAQIDVCGTVELHEMSMENDVMRMQQVPGGVIDIPAGETVELEVGGLHVMCIDKQVEFTVGEEIPLTLQFANAGDRTVTAEIRTGATDDMDMGGDQ